jgi:hypothetical protein
MPSSPSIHDAVTLPPQRAHKPAAKPQPQQARGPAALSSRLDPYRLARDPDTQRIAQSLGMRLEDYVELLIFYARDLSRGPELRLAPDEDLAQAGYTPPSVVEVGRFLLRTAARHAMEKSEEPLETRHAR